MVGSGTTMLYKNGTGDTLWALPAFRLAQQYIIARGGTLLWLGAQVIMFFHINIYVI